MEEQHLATEWEAFVAEAVLITESREDRKRRLQHARRDVERELGEHPLLRQLDSALKQAA